MNGTMLMLALGTLSYYTWAVSVGGDAYEDMMQADADKWLDEAIDRSGLLAILAEPRDALAKIPATAGYVTFSDERLTRRQGQDLTSMALGPSFGTANEAFNVIMGIDEPTKSTMRDARQLMPYQNVFYLRQLFTAVEEAGGANLPETRQ